MYPNQHYPTGPSGYHQAPVAGPPHTQQQQQQAAPGPPQPGQPQQQHPGLPNGQPGPPPQQQQPGQPHPQYVFFQTLPPRQATPVSQPGQFATIPQQPGPYPIYQQPPGTKTYAHGASAPTVYFPQGNPQHQAMKPPSTQAPLPRERKTLAIVDPSTGKNILDDMNNDSGKSESATSTPQSAESSTSNTPQPSGTPPSKVDSVDIAAQFANQVAMVAAEINDITDSSRTKSDKTTSDSSGNVGSSSEHEAAADQQSSSNVSEEVTQTSRSSSTPVEMEKSDVEKQITVSQSGEQEKVATKSEVEKSAVEKKKDSEVSDSSKKQEGTAAPAAAAVEAAATAAEEISKTELPTTEPVPSEVTTTTAAPVQETVVADEQVAVSREQTPAPAASSKSPTPPVSAPQDETEMKTIPEDLPSQTKQNTNTQDKKIEEKDKSEPSKPVLENSSKQNDLQSDVQSVSESIHKKPEVPQKSDNQSQVAAAKVSKEEEKMVEQVEPTAAAALNTAEVKETTPAPAAKEMSPQNEQTTVPQRSQEMEQHNSIPENDDNNEDDDQEKENSPGPQLQYAYKDDQWSPINPDGKRQYDRSFLLELQNNPLSLKKPEALPNLEVVRDGVVQRKASFEPSSRGSMSGIKNMGGGNNDFTPGYVRSSTGNKGGGPKQGGRNSQQGNARGGRGGDGGGGGGNQGRGGQKVININLSNREPAKLKTVANAWKPAAKAPQTPDENEGDTQEVLRKMKGILNKLTPEKFEKLVGSVKAMPINTTERLSLVIDLIFEKAVDEQSFSTTYAQMCQVLSLMSVKAGENDTNKSEVKFRNLIINKCQKEFEKDNFDENEKTTRLKEIEAETDSDKKMVLKAKFDYDETRLRKRSVGNIRFIGELYKLRMLTSPIMMRIIGTLLEKGDEESLECLCKLLTTIGKILETQCNSQAKALAELDRHFKRMDSYVKEKKTNSRVRFLMMDVIDLRRNGWTPRREDNNPKTKAQVHEDAKKEEFDHQMMLATTPNKRDDRDRDRGDRGDRRKQRGPPSDPDGWNTVATSKGRASFDSSRLKNMNTFSRPNADPKAGEVTLGPQGRSGFGSWGMGSSGGKSKDKEGAKEQEQQQQQQPGNRFNVLMDSMGPGGASQDNRRSAGGHMSGGPRLAPGGGGPRQGGFGSKSMPPPSNNDKESALAAVKKFAGGADRSKSTSRPESRESSITRENDGLKGARDLDIVKAEKYTKTIVEEFTVNVDPQEAKLCVKEKFSSNTIKLFVQSALEWVLDRDSAKRKLVGQLFHDLLLDKLLQVEQFIEGSKETLMMTEDFAIDIPQVCNYFGEIFAPCLNDAAISLQTLEKVSKFAEGKSADVLACILTNSAKLMSPNKVAELWNSSGLSWNNILPPSANVTEFLTKHKLAFILDGSKASDVISSSKVQPHKVDTELNKLFKRASNEEIFSWIEVNVGNDAKGAKFVRALVTALVENQATTSNDGSSIRVGDDFEEKMKTHLPVVLKYVDSNDKLELQCIYALQALSVKHQHPPGLLEKCFNAFYDSEVVGEEAFDEWAKSNDPEEQEGKGVCINSVKNFMRWLKEADVEDTENHA